MTIDQKIKELMKNPKAVEIIDKYIPGFSTDKQLKMAYGMTLRAIFKFPQMVAYVPIVDNLAKELEEI